MKFNENDDDDDSEIHFLDENYDKNDDKSIKVTLAGSSSKLFTSLDASEIVDSFAVKEDEEYPDADIEGDERLDGVQWKEEDLEDQSLIEEGFEDEDLEDEDLGGEDGDSSKISATTAKGRIRKFSEHIRNALESKFLSNNFISGPEKSELAKRLDLTERQVQKWFIHRREKLRRLQKKIGIPLLGVRRGNYHSNQQLHSQINPMVPSNQFEPARARKPQFISQQLPPHNIRKPIRNGNSMPKPEENPYKKIYFTKTSHIKYEDVNYEAEEEEPEEELAFDESAHQMEQLDNQDFENSALNNNQEFNNDNNQEFENGDDNFDFGYDFDNEMINNGEEDEEDEPPCSANSQDFEGELQVLFCI